MWQSISFADSFLDPGLVHASITNSCWTAQALNVASHIKVIWSSWSRLRSANWCHTLCFTRRAIAGLFAKLPLCQQLDAVAHQPGV